MQGEVDAIIVGSGPNGLSAAITLQLQGLKTIIFEQASEPGGATRTAAITLPGFKHDLGSAIHPLAFASPVFGQWPLSKYGLDWVHPQVAFAHPMPDGSAVGCYQDIEATANQLGSDRDKYIKLYRSLLKDWKKIKNDVLGPLKWPSHPLSLLRFGLQALPSASFFIDKHFKEEKSKLFFYGAAAHSTIPLTNFASASFGLVLNLLAHEVGWPFPKGGASAISQALLKYYQDIGGTIFLDKAVKNIDQLPKHKVLLLNLTPRQVLNLNNTNLNSLYRRRLKSYKYGAGIFKIDWALSGVIPFTNETSRKAGTVHLGFDRKSIELSEKLIHQGEHFSEPYVLLAQNSVFDPSRAPKGKHTAWAYCHVPFGSKKDMTEAIEHQIERAAPGFKKLIMQRATHNTTAMEEFNPNIIGGDINGGRQDITQLFTRPMAKLTPYRTSNRQIYICSSSTPPGGGVHGMAGFNAAKQVLKDHFKFKG